MNDNSNPLWDDNLVQFARLLREIVATTDEIDMEALAFSMDLEVEDVTELFERAHEVWEIAKANTTNAQVEYGEYIYDVVEECIADGVHGSSADDDGFCNLCGNGPVSEDD